MTLFEQRLIAARARLVAAHQQFITEILLAVHEASAEALEQAFVDALAARPRLADAPRADAPRTTDAAPALAPKEITEITVSMTDAGRVLARVREAPGSHVGQLSESLAMPPATVRRHLRQLAAKEVIRIEAAPDRRIGGQRLQTFFPREPDSVGSEMPASAMEATA